MRSKLLLVLGLSLLSLGGQTARGQTVPARQPNADPRRVTVPDFLNLELAEPFRTFTDQELSTTRSAAAR